MLRLPAEPPADYCLLLSAEMLLFSFSLSFAERFSAMLMNIDAIDVSFADIAMPQP